MADVADLERRLRILEDKDAIKRVKAKYLWCNDKKLWVDILDCFTEDAYVQYGEKVLHGAKAEADFLASGSVGRPTTLSFHHIHDEEIDILNDREAKARWQVQVIYVDQEVGQRRFVNGVYDEQYVKQDGKWKIKRLVLSGLLIENATWANHL